MRSVIIYFLFNYCALTFSQNVNFTRIFDTRKSNVPLQILNNQPDYFYVLRYDKKGHDFTLERRSKPDAKVLAYTPLRLEKVNASWFNFENLDYHLVEIKSKVYFIFEKAENTQRSIYVKVIDTIGQPGEFRELATISKDKTMNDFRFIFNVTPENKLLIVGEQYYYNQSVKKTALLYDVEKGENIWVKKLPIENPYTGYSRDFTSDKNNNLFFVSAKSYVVNYRRKFVKGMQMAVPVVSYDTLSIVSLLNGQKTINKRSLAIPVPFDLKSITLVPDSDDVTALVHYAGTKNFGDESVCLFSGRLKNDLTEMLFSSSVPINEGLFQKMTFFDGTDYKGASDKEYITCDQKKNENYIYCLSERKEENYYKELFFWQIESKTGKIMSQQILPRKIFYFDGRTRFKNIGHTTQFVRNNSFYSFILEDKHNIGKAADDFDFHKFSKLEHVWDGCMMLYCVKENGKLEKKAIYQNGNFDFIPVKYTSNQDDFIFYLNDTKKEKFGFLDLKGI